MKNDLIHQSRNHREYVVGLDAGGTRTRAVLAAAADGQVLAESVAGPGNALSVPFAELTDNLVEAIGGAVPERLRASVAAVGAGFAGAASKPADEPGRTAAGAALRAAFERLGMTPSVTPVYSDLEAAFAAAPGAPDRGLALVAGTGAVAARIEARTTAATVDGNGWLLGDDGSGFWLGRAAVRAALRAADGRGEPTALAVAVGRALLPGFRFPEADPRHWSAEQRESYRMGLVPAVMSEAPTRLARLVPSVVETALAGDPVAVGLLDRAADHLAASVRALGPCSGERLVVTGGLLGPGGPLTTRLADRLAVLGLAPEWTEDGRRGAVAFARLALGPR